MPRYCHFAVLLIALHSVALAADPTGIWMGEAPGKKEEKQDISIQIKRVKNILTGVMFGDEFDLPLQDLKVEGDQISFSVVATNYYSGNRATTSYTGTIAARELHLTRERKEPAAVQKPDEKPDPKTPFTLTRVAP